MIRKYNTVSIIYGGSAKKYAELLNKRIVQISEEERYPIRAAIINERILTRELLADVMNLFRNSQFCVAFFTKDDICLIDGKKTFRLRQNVVFEIGMAMIEIGRERCILLSDFNIKDAEFELPSDMNSLEIVQFDANYFKSVIDDIIEKVLELNHTNRATGQTMDTVLKYDKLLTRKEYWIDYENIFDNQKNSIFQDGKLFFEHVLSQWIDECSSLPHFDEKCIYILERIGVLPILGRTSILIQFIEQVEKLIENYSQSDIKYYGGSDLLDFTRTLVQFVLEYTRLKLVVEDNEERNVRIYKTLLQDIDSERNAIKYSINPLINLVYNDYMGLTNLRIYRADKTLSSLQKAKEYFIKSLDFVSSVDMSMQIWTGFITYNLARVCSECGDIEDAERYYNKSIKIRRCWLKNTKYNVIVRNALSYEYFITKINFIDMCQRFDLMDPKEIQNEYNYIENELNTYSDIDEKIDQLIYIRKLLKNRRKDL